MVYMLYYRVICECLHHFKCLIVKISVILTAIRLKLEFVFVKCRCVKLVEES